MEKLVALIFVFSSVCSAESAALKKAAVKVASLAVQNCTIVTSSSNRNPKLSEHRADVEKVLQDICNIRKNTTPEEIQAIQANGDGNSIPLLLAEGDRLELDRIHTDCVIAEMLRHQDLIKTDRESINYSLVYMSSFHHDPLESDDDKNACKTRVDLVCSDLNSPEAVKAKSQCLAFLDNQSLDISLDFLGTSGSWDPSKPDWVKNQIFPQIQEYLKNNQEATRARAEMLKTNP